MSNVNIPVEIITKLRKLIGIDLVTAMKVFREYNVPVKVRGYGKKSKIKVGGFPEELVSFLLELDRPTSKKGADFEGLFEVKTIQARFTKRNLLRTCGDTPISNWNNGDKEFEQSNIWNKLNKTLCIFHKDGIIIDIRFFDGETYKDILKKDFELIKNRKNSQTTIITRKSTGSVQVKKNGTVHLTNSISEDIDNEINNQEGYIINLFGKKLAEFKETQVNKTNINMVERWLNNPNTSITELYKIQNMISERLVDSEGFEFKEDKLEF